MLAITFYFLRLNYKLFSGIELYHSHSSYVFPTPHHQIIYKGGLNPKYFITFSEIKAFEKRWLK